MTTEGYGPGKMRLRMILVRPFEALNIRVRREPGKPCLSSSFYSQELGAKSKHSLPKI